MLIRSLIVCTTLLITGCSQSVPVAPTQAATVQVNTTPVQPSDPWNGVTVEIVQVENGTPGAIDARRPGKVALAVSASATISPDRAEFAKIGGFNVTVEEDTTIDSMKILVGPEITNITLVSSKGEVLAQSESGAFSNLNVMIPRSSSSEFAVYANTKSALAYRSYQAVIEKMTYGTSTMVSHQGLLGLPSFYFK